MAKKQKKTGVKSSSSTKWATVWVYIKRFLRTIIPQALVLFGYFNDLIPTDWLPVWVLFGGIITALDKFMRDMGYYTLG